VAARLAGANENTSGTKGRRAGTRHASGGYASLHLATRGRNVKTDAPCDDPRITSL
jgi:hypothetical protein